MDNEKNLVEWEDVRKNKVTSLVVVDLTGIENKDPFVKQMSFWADKFRKLYDKITVKFVTDPGIVDSSLGNLSTTNSINASNAYRPSKELLILEGIRKETDEEFRARMNITGDSSWSIQYKNLTQCSLDESKEEMFKMLKSGVALTPEQWIADKRKQVETFLNVKNDSK